MTANFAKKTNSGESLFNQKHPVEIKMSSISHVIELVPVDASLEINVFQKWTSVTARRTAEMAVMKTTVNRVT